MSDFIIGEQIEKHQDAVEGTERLVVQRVGQNLFSAAGSLGLWEGAAS